MKRTRILKSIGALAGIALAAIPAHADFLKPVDATASTTFGTRLPVDTVNNVGMTGTGLTATHNNNANDMWLTNGSPSKQGTIRFDLGAPYLLNKIYLWNYNEGNGSRGIKDFTIEVSLDDVVWGPPTSGGTQVAAKGGNTGSLALTDTLSFQAYARYVRFNITDNHSGDQYVGLSEVAFNTLPVGPPNISSTDPADNTGGVNPNAKLVANFDRPVQLHTGGTIYLTDLTDGTGNTTIAADDLSQTWVDTASSPLAVQIMPTGGLEFGTTYAVTFGQGNTISDIATTVSYWADTTWTTSSWNVTTEAFNAVAPVITTKDPLDDADPVASDTTITATFDQQILIGSGNITLKEVGGSIISTIAVTDASQVSLGATNQLVINPASDLPATTQIAVQLDAGVVTNYSAVGNAAITDETTWNFKTGETRDFVWDPSGGGPGSDGNGTWLGAGEWWDSAGAANGTWINAYPDNATIGSGGTGATIDLTGDVTAGTVLFDNYTGEYKLSNGNLQVNDTLTWGPNTTRSGSNDGVEFQSSSSLSGDGEVVVNGNYPEVKESGQFNIRTSDVSAFTGTWNVSNGVLFTEGNFKPSATSNIILNGKAGASNGAVYSSRWGQTLDRPLGTADNQIRVIGNRSGFEGQGTSGLTVRLDGPGNQEVTWGTTHFNPSVLILQSPNSNLNSGVVFDNDVDLNGATRTIEVDVDHGNGIGNSSFNDGRGQMSRAITNADTSTTAGLIKEGPGNLWFTATNTYDGGLTVNEGGVRFDRAANLPSTGTHTFNTGIEMQVNIGGGDDFTFAGTGAGSLHGLLNGTGPGTSTVTYSGDVDLTLRGSGSFAGDIPNLDAGGTTDLWLLEGNTTLSGNNTFSGALGVGRRGGGARTLTLGSSTALAGQPSPVVVDTSGTSKIVMGGFNATIGQLQLGSNNGGQGGTVEGVGTLTITGGVLCDSHNDGGGRINNTALDLNGTTQLLKHTGNNRANSDLIIGAAIQNGGVTTNATNGQTEIYFNGANTYTGGTTHEAGRLVVDGSLADASMSITGGEVRGNGTLTFNIVGSSIDQVITSGGNINIDTMSVVVAGTPADTTYVLVDATGSGSLLGTGQFGGSVTLPAGYVLDYGTANIVKIVGTPAGGSAFDTWATSNGVPTGSQAVDSDTGGLNNLGEFGLGGDPTDGNDDGSLLHAFSANVAGGAEDEGILTIAVRNAAVGLFSTADPSVSAAADGIVYTVAADTTPDVDGGGLTVTPTAAVTTGLDPAPAGYTYVSFYISGTEGYFQVTVAPE